MEGLEILESVQSMTELEILQSIQDATMTELEILQQIQDILPRILDILLFIGGIGIGIAIAWGLVRWMD